LIALTLNEKKPAAAGFFYASTSLPGEGKSKQSLTLK